MKKKTSNQFETDDKPTLRMRDLIRESGLPRETIHYYFNEGLLPSAYKVKKNSAFYGPEHLERLQQIRILREERFLPIKAIKAIYAQKPASKFSDEQLDYFRHLRLRFPDSVNPGAEKYIPLSSLASQKISDQELADFVKQGLVDVVEQDGEQMVTKEDAVVLETWVQFNKLGFTREKGYSPSLLNLWDKAIEEMVSDEFSFIAPVILDREGEDVVDFGARVIDSIERLIQALHVKKARKLFATLEFDDIEVETDPEKD
ncbi:MerR family transcriptional regulator [Emcibacter sp.]|uniref:MerR family transcriptional regulator n=1 Tax=Emcibacter sp. TaxID=1979954 RepID=UPI002AA7EBC4|nr:MerR family transcriptional regulator [Emcibacter sp.]